MLDSAHTMWLPGFEPDFVADLPIPAPQKPLAVEVKEYVCEIVRKSWPALRADLWDRAFTPVERFEMNCKALTAAKSLTPGEAPDVATRETLSLFTGWGALSEVFSPRHSSWEARKATLEALLGEDFSSARKAVTTSFFTPPALVATIWGGIQKLGFKGGKILEPSAGSGMFLQQMPSSIAKRSMVTAIDLDATSSQILGALYGSYGVKVINSSFEKAKLPQDFYDLVVTNVPFGDFPALETRSVPFRDFRIHDYFLARSLEVVRPGGLVVAITSSGTMDKMNKAVRAYLSTVAELVEAIRLPTSAFKAFAGTEPTTDVLIFRRLEAGELVGDEVEWVDSDRLKSNDSFLDETSPVAEGVTVNRWFRTHRERALGKLVLGTSGYRTSLCCEDDGSGYLSRLESFMADLPEGTYSPSTQRGQTASRHQGVVVEHASGLMSGSFLLHHGQLAIAEGDQSVIVEGAFPERTKERIRGMMQVRDVCRSLIRSMTDSADEVEPQRLRDELNSVYDRFVKAHGPLTSTANSRAFYGDPAAPLLHSLEHVAQDGSVSKAEIFRSRTIGAVTEVTWCDTSEDALQVSLARKGCVDLALMATLRGVDVNVVIEDLAPKGVIFKNPDTHQWETADDYLSGDVKTKLSMAEMAGDDFIDNVLALRKVIPEDIAPRDIAAKLGSTWIPLSTYQEFIEEVLGGSGANVSYEARTGTWDCKIPEYQLSATARQEFSTMRTSLLDLLVQSFNQQVPTVTDPHPTEPKKRVVNQQETIAAREKQTALRDRFSQWLWEKDSRAEQLAARYNDTFNRIVERKYDGRHLTLPGFSNIYKLREHQRDAVWRIISSKRNTLLAHCVGAGKTLEMICAGMELKRLGLATKPAYVVPNHMLSQFSADFLRAYPGANVLVASKEDFAGENRRRFLSRIATNNWDAVVITHATFERIKMSPAAVGRYIKDQLNQLQAALAIEREDGHKATVKQLERSLRQWEARLEKLANQASDEKLDLDFEELGIDWLMCDEAHGWKNLFRFSKMARIAGLPNSNAEKSFDMLMKSRHVSALHGWTGGVTFATGTPVSNSLAELYTMQFYLDPMGLRANDIEQFDAWAANFGEAVSAIEIAPDGGSYRMNTRFARFTNLPELMGMFRRFADIKTRDMLDLPVPAYRRETITATPNAALKAYVKTLVERSEMIKNGRISPSVDNMLKITNDGRKAALDMRLVADSAADDPASKVNLCVENVLRIYRETEDERSAQVIFSDLGTPTGVTFSVYDDIKTKLVANGVPEVEVAFAHDAASDAAKEALAERVRKGDVRVIIGSTQKLGVGTNMQDRLIALHHLDAPWRPSDIEQREGRIIRQGNTHDDVSIYTYVTSGSFDCYLWQTLETKQRFISQVMHGGTGARSAEDLELAALTYAEVKALASGNPLVLEKAGVDSEVAVLSIMQAEHERQQWANKGAIRALPGQIASDKQKAQAMRQDQQALAQKPTFMAGKTVIPPANIGAYIEKVAKANLFPGSRPVTVGTVGAFTLLIEEKMLGGPRMILKGQAEYSDVFSGKAVSAERTLARLLTEIPEELDRLEKRIERDERRLQAAQLQIDVPFGKADRLAELLERQAEINLQLGIGEGEKMAVDEA